MKKLFQENFKKHELTNPSNINGGCCGNTSYKTSSGKSGSDVYHDTDDDGKLNKGDDVLLDNGQWIVKN
ncbi:hypothetical protein [Polaribacter sp. IC073]|uniref:hypothetical protein n=1 Tax=Polaribacter sp. IC073 TaxID=2508540 RepID=UPI0011BF6260|nr:hypothetical protein [Polaribacter sp. IC073]TXD49766.1 hypothetical protein ES045_00855 [Polaribacter sp. IC073]